MWVVMAEVFLLIWFLDAEHIDITLRCLKVSLGVLVIAFTLALPLSTWLAIYRLRQCRFAIATLNALMSLPPVVVGLIACLLLSRSGPRQIATQQFLPHGKGMSVLGRGPI
jgi:tungstate transport system permease protein